MPPFGDVLTKRPVATILSEKDQFILGTLFYPFSVRFGYREADPKQFQKDLKKIRPLLDEMALERQRLDQRVGHDDLERRHLVE